MNSADFIVCVLYCGPGSHQMGQVLMRAQTQEEADRRTIDLLRQMMPHLRFRRREESPT